MCVKQKCNSNVQNYDITGISVDSYARFPWFRLIFCYPDPDSDSHHCKEQFCNLQRLRKYLSEEPGLFIHGPPQILRSSATLTKVLVEKKPDDAHFFFFKFLVENKPQHIVNKVLVATSKNCLDFQWAGGKIFSLLLWRNFGPNLN